MGDAPCYSRGSTVPGHAVRGCPAQRRPLLETPPPVVRVPSLRLPLSSLRVVVVGVDDVVVPPRRLVVVSVRVPVLPLLGVAVVSVRVPRPERVPVLGCVAGWLESRRPDVTVPPPVRVPLFLLFIWGELRLPLTSR